MSNTFYWTSSRLCYADLRIHFYEVKPTCIQHHSSRLRWGGRPSAWRASRWCSCGGRSRSPCCTETWRTYKTYKLNLGFWEECGFTSPRRASPWVVSERARCRGCWRARPAWGGRRGAASEEEDMWGCQDTKIRMSGYEDIRIQGYVDLRIQGYKDIRISGYGDARIKMDMQSPRKYWVGQHD